MYPRIIQCKDILSGHVGHNVATTLSGKRTADGGVVNKQIALISRWHRRVIESGTRLLSTSCFDNTRFIQGHNALADDVRSFEPWRTEFTIEIIDSLHDFCFFLRKVIERANVQDQAKLTYPHEFMEVAKVNQGSPDEKEVILCKKDLWWILGRVIHSTSVVVVGGFRSDVIYYKDGKTREYANSRVYVEIESDMDRNTGKKHVIYIPALVHCYVSSQLAHQVQDVVRKNTL